MAWFFLASTVAVQAQVAIPIDGEARRQVTLARCLKLALENNFGLKASRLSAQSSGTGVAQAESEFDPVIRSTGRYQDATTPTASSLEGTQNPETGGSTVFVGNLGPSFSSSQNNGSTSTVPIRQTYSWDLTVSKKFATGLEASATYFFQRLKTNQFFATINPSYTSQMRLDFTQPLLRGGWFAVNLANLRQSENQLAIAREQLREAVDELVFNVQQTYWDLVYSLDDLEVKRESLRLAEILKRDNLEKFRAGTMTKLDVTQADFEIATRKNDVIKAVAIVKNTMDKLRQYVEPSGFDQGQHEEWFPVDRPLQEAERPPLAEEALKIAFQNRGDWKEAILTFENAKLEEDALRNQILPRLDLNYSLQYNGIGDNSADPFRDVLRTEFDTWGVGFNLEYPIGNRSARASYLKGVLDRRKAQAEIEELRSSMHVEIRDSVRTINTTLETIKQTREALRFAREQLKGEQLRLDVGKSTSYKVLEVQEDLAQAQIDERRALLDHMIARARLEKSQGTILMYYGLVASPEDDRHGR